MLSMFRGAPMSSVYRHVLAEFRRCQLALIAPTAQLLDQFRQHLPEQKCWFRCRCQLAEQLLGFLLLRWFVLVKSINEDVRIKSVPGVARDSSVHHAS